MSKLREKFENNIIGVVGEISITEDFAIKFAEWFIKNREEKEVGYYDSIELVQFFKDNFYE
jgi:hypothetical protein